MTQVKSKRDRLVVHFDHATGLKTKDGKAPTGFWLADDSGKWSKADAIINDETIELSSPKVAEPKFVRYAFAGKPIVNLINEANLPAFPFRTDQFEH